jgi:hypothetical protein
MARSADMPKTAYWIRALLAAVVCIAGIYIFAGYLDPSYPIRQWLTWRLGVIWFWCAVLNVAMLAFGAWLVARMLGAVTLHPLEALVTSLTVGIVGLGILLYVAGFLGLLRPWLVVPLLVALIAIGGRSGWNVVRRAARELGQLSPPRTPLGHLLVWTTVAWAAWGLSFMYLGALTPSAINHDAAWYHLTMAVDYAREGRIVPYQADYLCTLPHMMSVIYAGAFLLPGLGHPVVTWMLALHVEFSMVLWTLVGVAAGARWMLGGQRVRMLWAAFLLFPGIYVYDMNIGGSADHFLGVFTVPLFLAAVRASERFAVRRCLLLGVLAAGAALTKYQSVYLLVSSAVLVIPRWLWLVAQQRFPRLGTTPGLERRALLVGPAVVVLVGVVLTAPHFLKNVVFYGNPLYPFAQDIFTASHPAQPNSAETIRGLLTDGTALAEGAFGKRLTEAFGAFFTFSFESHYVRPGSVLVGSLFTLLSPLAFVVREKRRIWVGIVSLLFAVLTWGMTLLAERYLQILTPLMAVVVAALLVRAWQLGWIARAGLVPLVLLQVVAGGDMVFAESGPRLQDAIELIRSGDEGRRDDESRFTYRSAERQLGEYLPRDAVLLLHSTVMNLGMAHQARIDIPGKQGLLDYDRVSDTRGLWQLYRGAGITHVAHMPGMLGTHNRAHDVLFIDFMTTVAVRHRQFGAYEVAEVPETPPPPEPHYRVVCLGINYADGLYAIEQMRVHEDRRPVPDIPPPPRVQWPSEESAQLGLVGQAHAVIVGARFGLPPAIGAVLSQQFQQAEVYKDRFSIWIRSGRGE